MIGSYYDGIPDWIHNLTPEQLEIAIQIEEERVAKGIVDPDEANPNIWVDRPNTSVPPDYIAEALGIKIEKK